ncbi:hypothetical protein NKJ90_09415 [Mesorhizobium sp. M0051]|uniref:hypothetical protein n=1 Tax=Mesorhizobium sp. M0051 TaxID=2956862 RepID=UPI0033376ADC
MFSIRSHGARSDRHAGKGDPAQYARQGGVQLRQCPLLPFGRPDDGLWGGVDPLKLKFDCSQCKPEIKITLLEIHPEHLPKRLMIHKPMKVDGTLPTIRQILK